MTFEEMTGQDKPVLVDFFAHWCGPCKTMGPVLEEVKRRLGDSASVIKIDVDKNPQAASNYDVRSIPTLLLFKKGAVIWRRSGVAAANELEKIINANK